MTDVSAQAKIRHMYSWLAHFREPFIRDRQVLFRHITASQKLERFMAKDNNVVKNSALEDVVRAHFITHCPFGFDFTLLRPFQFNYLSYELFLEKKSCQTPKKKKKSHLWCLTDESGFEIFCQTPKNVQVLKIFFVRVIQSSTGDYHCCSRASDLRRYTSHPSGYRD